MYIRHTYMYMHTYADIKIDTYGHTQTHKHTLSDKQTIIIIIMYMHSEGELMTFSISTAAQV